MGFFHQNNLSFLISAVVGFIKGPSPSTHSCHAEETNAVKWTIARTLEKRKVVSSLTQGLTQSLTKSVGGFSIDFKQLQTSAPEICLRSLHHPEQWIFGYKTCCCVGNFVLHLPQCKHLAPSRGFLPSMAMQLAALAPTCTGQCSWKQQPYGYNSMAAADLGHFLSMECGFWR